MSSEWLLTPPFPWQVAQTAQTHRIFFLHFLRSVGKQLSFHDVHFVSSDFFTFTKITVTWALDCMSQLLHNPQFSLVSIQSFDSVNNMFHVVSVMFWLQQTIRITFDFLQWLWPWLFFSCLYYWIGVIFSFQHDLAEWHSCVASPEDDPAGLCALARHQAGDNWMDSRVSITRSNFWR